MDEPVAPAGDDLPGSGGQNVIPEDWAENDVFKEFYDDKAFDFNKFSESYIAAKENQPIIPETSDDYKFEFPDGEYHTEEADIKSQREMAKEAGMTQSQYEAMVKFDIDRFAKAQAEIIQQRDESKAALIKEWGGTEKFEANMAEAAKIAVMIFGEDFKDRVDLGNDIQLIKGLYSISKKISEDTLKTGQAVSPDTRRIGVDGERLFTYSSH